MTSPYRTFMASARVAGLIPLLAVSVVAACGDANAEAVSLPDVVTLSPDDIAVVESQRLVSGPIISGTLVPRVRTIVRAEVGGAVVATYVERGMRVAAGAPLARIDDATRVTAHASAQSGVRSAEGTVASAQRRAARMERLLAGGAVSAETTEDARQAATAAESELAAAHARLASAAQDLAHATVRAPIAGAINARSVNPGDLVQPGDVMFEVIDPTTMRLEASVPAAQLSTVQVGAPVSFTVTGYPGRVFLGRIESVSPSVDASTRQVPVVVAIDNRGGALVAGLFAEGQLTAETRTALIAPAFGVDVVGDSAFVLRVLAGRVTRSAVGVGASQPDRGSIEIVSGLAAGDTILVSASHGITAGTAIRVAAAAPTSIVR